MTTQDFINNINTTRGQWAEEVKNSGICERHHILPKCKGGLPNTIRGWEHHPNIIWLYPHEHFIIHKLYAEEHPYDISAQKAWFMLARYKGKFISAEEYEELRIKRLEIFSTPEYKELQSKSSKGRKWYNNGVKSIFVFEAPEGYIEGRCQADKDAIGATSKGRKANKGKHWYTNDVEQIFTEICPEGWHAGTLPMSDEAKLAHSIAGKGTKRDYKIIGIREAPNNVDKRIDYNKFKEDFLINNLTDEEIITKYNLNKTSYKKYRQRHKLFYNPQKVRYNGN